MIDSPYVVEDDPKKPAPATEQPYVVSDDDEKPYVVSDADPARDARVAAELAKQNAGRTVGAPLSRQTPPGFAPDASRVPAVRRDPSTGKLVQALETPNPSASHLPHFADSLLRYSVNPMLENPLQTVITSVTPGAPVVMAGLMGKHVAEYGAQKAAEQTLPPDVRELAERDPDRISGEQATVEGTMLALPLAAHGALHAVSKLPVFDVGSGMMEAGAQGVKEAVGNEPVSFGQSIATEQERTAGRRLSAVKLDPLSTANAADRRIAARESANVADRVARLGTTSGEPAVVKPAARMYFDAEGKPAAEPAPLEQTATVPPAREPLTPAVSVFDPKAPAPIETTQVRKLDASQGGRFVEDGPAQPFENVPGPTGANADATQRIEIATGYRNRTHAPITDESRLIADRTGAQPTEGTAQHGAALPLPTREPGEEEAYHVADDDAVPARVHPPTAPNGKPWLTSARTEGGALRPNLANVHTDALADELLSIGSAQGEDNPGILVLENQSRPGNAPWVGRKEAGMRAAGRAKARGAALDRITKELESRGVDTGDALYQANQRVEAAKGPQLNEHGELVNPDGFSLFTPAPVGGAAIGGASQAQRKEGENDEDYAKRILLGMATGALMVEAGRRLAPGLATATRGIRGALAEGIAPELATERRGLERAASTDALTDLGNTRAWGNVVKAAEQNPAAKIIRFDLNGFKSVNDAVGHAAGDAALKHVAQTIREKAKGLPAFRVGGDEFAVIADAHNAEAVRDAIEQGVGVKEVAGENGTAKYSISGGVGSTNAEADAAAIARKAAHKAGQGIAERNTVGATGEADAAAGVEYRNMGIARRDLEPAIQAVSQAVTDSNAPIVKDHPQLAQAIASANAMTPTKAGTFVRQLGARALAGLTPDQQRQFGQRVTLDNIEAELTRKAGDAETVAKLQREATRISAQLPPNVETQPWFQVALKKATELVQPFTDAAAERAGVEPSTKRQPSLGLYTRLIPQDRINEPLIRKAHAIAENEGSSAITPRTGLARRVLGQKQTVLSASPVGTEAPLQGPVDVRSSTTGNPAISTLGSRQTGAANRVTGGRDYSTDFLANLQYDAGDKLSKGARNSIFSALADDAATGKSGVREIGADVAPPPGMRVVAFNDSKEIIDPQPTDPELSSKIRRFAVPKEVAYSINRFRQPYEYPSAAGRALQAGMGAVTKSVLLNPLVAGTHSLTLGSSVGTGIPAGAGPLRTVVTGLPGVKTVSTLARMGAVDFTEPTTANRLTRLAFSGALRLGEDQGAGLVDKGHSMLFGPSGVDTRARVIASEDVEASLAKAGITPNDPRFAGLERAYVTEHAGNYVKRNMGTATQWLQENGIAPFVAINRAKLGTSLKAIVGADGTVDPSAVHRLGIAWRGPLGAAASIAAAGYILSGHSPAENAPGHEGDMATGVYHAPDNTYRFFRGSPAEAVAQFGHGTKEVYLRRGIIDPSSEAALRVLQPLVTAHQGDKLHETLRAAVNTGLSIVGPGAAATFGLATGHSLYLDRDGNFGSLEDPTLPGGHDAGLRQRVVASVRNANAAAAMVLPAQGDQPANTPMGRPLFTAEANPLSAAGTERHEVDAWQSNVIQRIYSATSRADREQIMNDALLEADRLGYHGPRLRADFTKAVNRASIGGRSAATQQKFENRIRGPRTSTTP